MRLELRRGRSAKFWEPRCSGRSLTVRFGRIGTGGQTRRTEFATPAAARAALTKLVAEKRAKGYRPAAVASRATRSSAATAPKAATPAAGWTAARRAALLHLATALGGANAAAVRREVALAVDDPSRFLATSRRELFRTWDDDDTAPLPWLALIEALEAARRLAEVDWKEAGDEVIAWLETIGGRAARRALAAAHDATLDERPTEEVLALAGKLLGAAGLALLVLDKSSDSYPLMVVPAAAVAPAQRFARAARQRIEHATGDDLARLEARRRRQAARDRAANPWRQIALESDTRGRGLLYQLRHDRDGELAARLTAALPFAPPRDRPLAELSLAFNAGDPVELARTARDPELALRALDNLRDEDPRGRLRAAAVLAARLDVKPDLSKNHLALGEALNLWAAPRLVDAALAALPAADRRRLARLADGLLRRPALLSTAGRALANVGDATSLDLLLDVDARRRAAAIAHAAKHPSFSPEPWVKDAPVPRAIERIRHRLGLRPKRAR